MTVEFVPTRGCYVVTSTAILSMQPLYGYVMKLLK